MEGADMTRVVRDQGRAIQADPSGDRLIRIGQRVERQPNGCWYYDGEGDRYHMIRGMQAHRWFYKMLTKQTIPDGWHLHHKCERPGCVNPAHLEPLTPKDHKRAHSKPRLPTLR